VDDKRDANRKKRKGDQSNLEVEWLWCARTLRAHILTGLGERTATSSAGHGFSFNYDVFTLVIQHKALSKGGVVFTYKNSFNELTGCAPIIINFVVNVLWKRLKSNTISRQGVKERGAKQSFKIGKRRQTFPLHASTRYRDRQFERQDE
jgi:hypothetical protein